MEHVVQQLRDIVRRIAEVQNLGAAQRYREITRSSEREIAKSLLHERRLRAKIDFGEGLLGEPGWDILLDLYVRQESHDPVSIKSACIASGVPPTTALRWINVLEQAGLVEREKDASDARRSFVHLSPRGESLMGSYMTLVIRESHS